GNRTKEEGDQAEARLHGRSALVRGLPLRQKGAIVQAEPGRLLDATDIKRGAREQGCNRESEIADQHDPPLAFTPEFALRAAVPPWESIRSTINFEAP